VNLYAISGYGENVVTVVGERGTIVRFDGGPGDAGPLPGTEVRLLPEVSGTTAVLRGVFVLDADKAYAVGDGGTILARSGGKWTTVGAGVTQASLTAVWADKDRVVAVGERGVVLFGDAKGVFTVVPNDGIENLLAVTGSPGGSISAAGAMGVVFSVAQDALTRRPIAGFTKQLAGATTSSSGTYFVGVDGSVLRGSGGSFAAIEGFPSAALRGVAAPGAELWVVGFDGTVARRVGKEITRVTPLDGRWLTGLYAPSPSSIWIVGRSGVVLRGPPTSLTSAIDGGADGGADGGKP
jgi:hypothetical protein